MKAFISIDELPYLREEKQRIKQEIVAAGLSIEMVRVWTGQEDWDHEDIEPNSKAWEFHKSRHLIRPCTWIPDPSNPDVTSDYVDEDGTIYRALGRDWSADTKYKLGCVFFITKAKEPKKPRFL
jgi:hypothetical protein